MERYLTPSEVAQISSMSKSGVIKWIREGKVVEINGRWRIPYSEIERLLSGSGRVKQSDLCSSFTNTKGLPREAIGENGLRKLSEKGVW